MELKIFYSVIMLITGKIVIVDDEDMVIKTLKTLLKIEGFSNVNIFNDTDLALEYIRENPCDLIISDFIMPKMNGIEFLSKAKQIHPDTTQILLTGYADKENAIRAINELGIFKYIEKPWINDDIILNIKNGIERTRLKSQLKNKIEELEVANSKLEEYSKSLEEKVAERTKDLNVSNVKLNTILENLADGLVMFNSNNVIVQSNSRAKEFFCINENQSSDAKKDTLCGKNFFELIINEKDKKIDKNEKTLRDFSIIDYRENKKIPVEINLADVKIEDESYKIALIRDITFQKENERLRDDFIATLTHDLRTPLLASINALDFTLNGELGNLSDELKELLSVMKKSSEDMLGLVNALLEVYRYESGKLFLCKTHFSLNELIEECTKKLEPLLRTDNLRFEFTATASFSNDNSDITINADKNEIRRVVSNLLGNAIKHSKKDGTIKIGIATDKKDVRVDIIDFGEGLSKEDIEKLFKRFSQGTSKKRSASTGLGLYLSRQIVEAHNGQIFAKGEPNQGCTFSFILKNAIVEKQVV